MEQYRVNKVWVDNAHVWTETTNGWKANYPFNQWDNLAKAKQNQRSNFSLAAMAFIGQSSTKTFALRACSPMLVFANVQTVKTPFTTKRKSYVTLSIIKHWQD